MNDTTTIKVFQVIDNKDTVTYHVDKSIIEHFVKEKPSDVSHYIEILIPLIVVLVTFSLTKFYDFWTENRKYKKEISKENRKKKINFLKYLNTLKISFGKSHFRNADYEDFLGWIADKMVGTNPFEDLKINSNIVFNGDIELIENIDELFNNANTINGNFNWTKKEHPNESLTIAKEIYDKLGKVINNISKNLT